MYLLLKLLANFVGLFSPESIDKFAKRFAWFLFDIVKLRRQLIIENIRRSFGTSMTDDQIIAMGRTSVYHFVCTILEIFYSQRHNIISGIQIDGREHMQKALSQNKGVYVLCCHMGNWEAMGAKYTHDIRPARVIVKKIGVASVNRFVEGLRDKNGFLSISRKKKGDGYRQIIETLNQNNVVGFVMDQARRNEPKLQFFGHPARTNTSFAAIWQKRPAPILPSFMIRHGFNRHTVYIWPEVELQSTPDAANDVLRFSQQFNDVVEKIVRFCPEQYFWMHDRWK
jgi:KDO2-lipid IV(A) lauroyltransferase